MPVVIPVCVATSSEADKEDVRSSGVLTGLRKLMVSTHSFGRVSRHGSIWTVMRAQSRLNSRFVLMHVKMLIDSPVEVVVEHPAVLPRKAEAVPDHRGGAMTSTTTNTATRMHERGSKK
jgi:hypothetical protein